jgi:PRTRC genetic system protein E
MFTALASILAANQVIDISVGAVGADGRMKIIVKPQLNNGTATALAQPLALVATPQELDAEFVTVLNQYAVDRLSLQQQVEVTATIIADAKKEELGKAAKAIKAGAKQSSNKVVDAGDGDDAGDGYDAGGTEVGDGILDNAPSSSNGIHAPSAPAPTPASIQASAPSNNNNDDLLALLK